MTSAFTWAFGFIIGATVGWICRARQLPMGPPKGSYGPRQPGPYNSHPRGIEPSAPGMRRIYYGMPSTIAECGGPCAAGPRHCDCGALWRDEPVRLDPGNVQRGNGSGGPTTPKPEIVPMPQYPGGYVSLDGAQPLRGRRFQPLPDELDAYCPQDDTPNPPRW